MGTICNCLHEQCKKERKNLLIFCTGNFPPHHVQNLKIKGHASEINLSVYSTDMLVLLVTFNVLFGYFRSINSAKSSTNNFSLEIYLEN